MQNKADYGRKISLFSSHEQILALIGQIKTGKLLDLGSSDGILTKSLNDRGIGSTCIDLVDPAKVSAECERYIQHNLEDYKGIDLDKRYDCVVLADVIEHLRCAQGLLVHIKSFLKSDGRIIVSVPNIAIWVYRLSLLLGRFDYTQKGTLDETHVRFYTLKTIRELLESSGYSILRERQTSLPFEVVLKPLKGTLILKVIDRAYYFLAKFLPTLFAYQFVFECRPTEK